MTALKNIHELINTAVAFFHGPVDHTTPQPPPRQPQLVSLYGKCRRLGCAQTNVKRDTNCRLCGMYRPLRE